MFPALALDLHSGTDRLQTIDTGCSWTEYLGITKDDLVTETQDQQEIEQREQALFVSAMSGIHKILANQT